MREIKFRGVSKTTKEWIYGFLIITSELEKTTNRIYNVYYEEEKKYIYIPENDELSDWNSAIYEILPKTAGQYTGLKDKNSREIYEGDIIIEDKYKDLGGGYIVKWDKDTGSWIARNDVEEYFLYDLLNSDEISIIGNIYENPELINIKN